MFATDDPVLLVENPRLVEATAERALPYCVIATNGNPASEVMRLVDALLDAHIPVCHHGDFDGAGIAICRRLHAQGCTPWRIGWNDYVEALDVAADLGLELPVDASSCDETPWDSSLEQRFNDDRRKVHEELLLERLLADFPTG